MPSHEATYRDDSDWRRYGPECTYDVLVNMSLSNMDEDARICSVIAFELKCRAKGSDTLNCRFSNGRTARPEDGRGCSNAKRNFAPSTSDRFVDEQPFEIRFNARGIENLVVSRDIARWRLDAMRAIVSQLNVGFELGSGHDRFLAMENSSVGYCEVEVKVSRAGYGGESGGGGLEIALEPERADVAPLSRGSVRIEKVRRPKRCPNRNIYFFGNHRDFSFGSEDIFMDMVRIFLHEFLTLFLFFYLVSFADHVRQSYVHLAEGDEFVHGVHRRDEDVEQT